MTATAGEPDELGEGEALPLAKGELLALPEGLAEAELLALADGAAEGAVAGDAGWLLDADAVADPDAPGMLVSFINVASEQAVASSVLRLRAISN
ncbi:MAG: hypothetical protein JOZ39_10190 [Chloroflexi bacterium]|nr:hypothetical protein [Chloroflexota bacterium]